MMCSVEASNRSVVPGMKLTEAKAACADLQIREYDERLYNDSQQKLCRELLACSPKVSVAEPGLFVLDASGLSYLGGEKKLCRVVHRTAAKGSFLDVHIGIADSVFAAVVASKFKRRQYYIVPVGCDQDFLSPLPIKQLPISIEAQNSLHELGIRTMGQMVSLSEDALVQRFGKEGVHAWTLAHGFDKRQPKLPSIEKEFKCAVNLGSPIELLNEIQFVLKSMLDRLSYDLKQDGLWAEELTLTFFSNGAKFNERPVKLLRPSSNPKFLLEVLKLSLEAKPIEREITEIELSISRFGPETWEQSSVVNLQPSSEDEELSTTSTDLASFGLSLTLMLQRFVSRLGPDAVVRSVPNDQHIPDDSGAWLPVATKSSVNPVLPVNLSFVKDNAGISAFAAGLTLRKSRDPVPALVEVQEDLPCSITYEGDWYTVKEITQPERLSGLWWSSPVRRSYYVALLEPRRDRRSSTLRSVAQLQHHCGLLVLLVHDHEANGWFIEGFYD